MNGRDEALRERGGALYVSIRVRPRASAEGVKGLHGGRLVLAVRQPPERGRANEAVLSLLAGTLGLPRRSCALASGHASRDKSVRVEGLSLEEARSRLHPFLGRDA